MGLVSEGWLVKAMGYHDVAPVIREHHYSGGCSNTCTHAFALVDPAGDVRGGSMWLPPTKPAAESVNRKSWRRVLSLSRLAVDPECPKNSASFLIGGSVRSLRSEGKWVTLLTYADNRMGHSGAIYRATNWEYLGVTSKKRHWVDSEGRLVAARATRTRSVLEMTQMGYTRTDPHFKHKFVMHLTEKNKRRK